LATSVSTRTSIESDYLQRTPTSAKLTERAIRVMPGGVTRGFGFHFPYPAVMVRGEGCYLWDVDGNRYVDLINNGLALIHGHAFRPVVDLLTAQLPRAWAWLGTNIPQIEFAEALCARLATFERVLFTNSGTESGMLAVKLARHFTGKPLILKLKAGYHGSYSDLEAGLEGRGEIPGHTLLADFNDLDSFERQLVQYSGQIAAVIVEPVMYTGVVMIPDEGFLSGLEALARRHGALFIVDDCLMLRLAYGGSAEKYGLSPDLTFLGKFLGGGIPVGAVGGRAEILEITSPRAAAPIYHGGSYNGNLLGCLAGKATMEHLTRERIAEMDSQVLALRHALESKAAKLGMPLTIRQTGSIMGIYFADGDLQPGSSLPNEHLSRSFHLACSVNGVHIGPGGVLAFNTAVTDEAFIQVVAGMEDALERTATST
jgi:glutamate-1-semialdehyde 2,1-aminomutase